MGYTPKRKRYNLKFENADYEGLKVSMTGSNLGEVLDSMNIGALMAEGDELGREARNASTPEQHRAIAQKTAALAATTDKFYRDFASHLIEWNVEEPPGTPVPPTFEGTKTQELTFISDILTAWRTAVQGVAPDLSQPSNDGLHALEASLPMVPSSPNLSNLGEHSSYSDVVNGSVASRVAS
jgi:hypothetical protein